MILQPAYCVTALIEKTGQISRGIEPYLVENFLDGSSIIGLPVTFCTLIFDTDDLARSVVGILGVALSKDFPFAVEETRGHSGRRNMTLCPSLLITGSGVHIALGPRGDRSITTCK